VKTLALHAGVITDQATSLVASSFPSLTVAAMVETRLDSVHGKHQIKDKKKKEK
jgi:hypothetical protein